MWGSAARRRISVPMSDQRTACNPHWHIWHRCTGLQGYILSFTANIIPPQIDDLQCYTQGHPQLKNVHHWLHGRASSLGCISAAPTMPDKTGRTNPRNIFQGAIYHGILASTSSRYQPFGKLLWKQRRLKKRSSWNQMSVPIYQCHQTPSAQ